MLKMAAKDVGALREAKDKLEKRVEELTRQLDYEKHSRIDLEETKEKEITKLQNVLQQIQGKLAEAHNQIIHEKEAAKLAIEQAPPVVKEVPVVDNAKVEELTNHNHELKENANCKVNHSRFSFSLRSLIKKLQSENEFLRNNKVVEEGFNPITTPEKSLDNGQGMEDIFDTPNVEQDERRESGNDASFLTIQHKSLRQRQQENHDVLIKSLLEDKRFDQTRPVSACYIYKILVQWRSFEKGETEIFDRIIQTIQSSTETRDMKDLAYWLSTTSTLFNLLECTIKATSSPYKSPQRNRVSPTTLSGRMAKDLLVSPMAMGTSSRKNGVEEKQSSQSKTETKYHALLFKQHLAGCIEKLYRMIGDSLKKEIIPFLNLCIQAPKSTRVRSIRGASENTLSNIVAKQQASSIHWQGIVNCLDHTLEIMSENHVPSIYTRNIFSQVFEFIGVQLFNSLLLRRECCTLSNGEYVKSGLHELERWRTKATNQFAGSSWNGLHHIRQAVGLLVSHQKIQKSLEEITNELCP
nr:myosin-12-like isoform X1 [Tanacetum cinerariifolium]